jgi:flagellar hook-basal body protein
MSFYTSLTGLNAATAQLGVTSNNIANVGTTGFKRSRADFGDIFATSPLQKASSTIGQGVALKQVTQEFGQGNVAFSANALDLAITGDGFFPLKSADGLQDIYTRNGSFMMNDQYNVVNSAGQRLMAASVDSSGKADLGNLNVLTIPQQTTGEAGETSLINLGLNFPADATVITEPFVRTNPATYNKSTALTVYDSGGNGYLATVYYSKTQNASQLSPTNKWQTNVFVGDTQVNPSLIQATDNDGEELFVNKYGDIQPKSAVGDLLVNGKTQMFSLDDLTDTRTSQPASIQGLKAAQDLTVDTTYNFSAVTAGELASMFTIDVDNSETPVTVDLSHLAGTTKIMTGVEIAKELTNVLNTQFGDERYFNFTGNTKIQLNAAVGVVNNSVQLDLQALGSFKQEKLTFTAAAAAGNLTVGGVVVVGVLSTDTGIEVAGKVKVALVADLAFMTAGRSVVDNGDGTLTMKWAPADGAIGNITLADTGTTGTTPTTTVIAPYVAAIADITKVTTAKAVEAVQAAINAKGLTSVTVGFDAVNRGFTFTEENDGIVSLQTPQSFKDFTVAAPATAAEDLNITLSKGVAPNVSAVTFSISDITIADSVDDMVAKLKLATGYSSSGYSVSNVAGNLHIARNDGVAFRTQFSNGVTAYGSNIFENGSTVNLLDAVAGVQPTTDAAAPGVTSNAVFGLSTQVSTVGLNDMYTPIGSSLNGNVSPNGTLIRKIEDQRYGLKVTFDNVNERFSISSGSTGDASSITITDTNTLALSLLGLNSPVGADPELVAVSDVAERGTLSTAAVTTGTQVAINVNNNFSVDTSNNAFVVSVDDVKGTVTLPASDSYTLDGFMLALEKEINTLASAAGSTVSGVKVSYDQALNAFKFTTGTSGTDSFIKVSGSSNWGLANIDAGRGTTSSWIKPTQFQDYTTGVGVSKYIDEFGDETTSADGFAALPEWSPIYLDKGELTFNTSGNLISPQTGSQLDTVYLADGKGALTINIDYSASTQYSSAFAVLSQSQDGRPEGDLVGLDIGDDGLVSASYSNGTQNTLAKVILANFSSPAGLRQIGNSSFYSTAKSGDPKIGEAGSAGFGTVRAGATERANVDLTQELVDLITAQRNFQANSKAIETSSTMTQAIINIRS